jgi:hypothetical protein
MALAIQYGCLLFVAGLLTALVSFFLNISMLDRPSARAVGSMGAICYQQPKSARFLLQEYSAMCSLRMAGT